MPNKVNVFIEFLNEVYAAHPPADRAAAAMSSPRPALKAAPNNATGKIADANSAAGIATATERKANGNKARKNQAVAR